MSLCDEVKTVVVYGFEFVFNMDNLCNMRNVITELYAINTMIKAPFRVCGVLSSFDPMMCYSESRDMIANIVLGFTPDSDLVVTTRLIADLKEYIASASIFEKYGLNSDPAFFCGVEWNTDVEESDSEIDGLDGLEEFKSLWEEEVEVNDENKSVQP